MTHTTAPKHEDENVLTMTTAPKHEEPNGIAISRTLTPLEEYDMRTFGRILEKKEFVKDGVYYSFYNNISTTRRN